MLKRVYIDNFRCLVNFELTVSSINLFLGPNGAGKSTVFDVLRKIQAFVGGNDKVGSLFKSDDLTHWQKSLRQVFELEIEGNGGVYKYALTIEHDEVRLSARVVSEYLWFDSKPLLKFDSGNAQLYLDDYSEGPTYPFDSSRSLLASLPPRRDNTRLTWFKERMRRFVILQINPMTMVNESAKEEMQLSSQAENFVSWYRFISQNQGKAIEITNALREVMAGFDYFKFDQAGERHRVLKLCFTKDNGQNSNEYRLNELSDGQRVLITLYALTHYTQAQDYTLCIDEPENFLALPEIQPWLTLLYDFCSDGKLQALLISHHPELINYLASSAGYWFDRQGNTPVRVKRITEDESGMPIAELMARGWLYG